MDMEGLSVICAGIGIAEEDENGNRIGYSKGEYCLGMPTAYFIYIYIAYSSWSSCPEMLIMEEQRVRFYLLFIYLFFSASIIFATANSNKLWSVQFVNWVVRRRFGNFMWVMV